MLHGIIVILLKFAALKSFLNHKMKEISVANWTSLCERLEEDSTEFILKGDLAREK